MSQTQEVEQVPKSVRKPTATLAVDTSGGASNDSLADLKGGLLAGVFHEANLVAVSKVVSLGTPTTIERGRDPLVPRAATATPTTLTSPLVVCVITGNRSPCAQTCSTPHERKII